MIRLSGEMNRRHTHRMQTEKQLFVHSNYHYQLDLLGAHTLHAQCSIRRLRVGVGVRVTVRVRARARTRVRVGVRVRVKV